MKKTLLAMLLLAASHAHAIGHLADLTVVDRQLNRTLPVYWHAGRAWVEGRPGNEYQIVVRNQTGSDLLAVVSVDGVNVVTGETASPAQGGYVIDSWRNLDITGWRKSLSRTAAFYFTEIADSYASRTGRPDHVGVIGAALFRRKPEALTYEVAPDYAPRPWQNSVPPAASSAPMRERAEGPAADSALQGRAGSGYSSPAPAAKLGTGHGRSEVSRVRSVEFERATVNPEETITIFYDSRANLIARGIIRERPLPTPREPQPFPGGFVPDPRW